MRAALELTSDPTTAPLFPHPFVARLAVTAGDALELAFEVVNTGDAPFEFEIALHTYFAVSDVGAVAVRGLGGCRTPTGSRAACATTRMWARRCASTAKSIASTNAAAW